MILPTIEPAQQTAAKVAGFLYLFLMVTGVFAEFYARGSLIVQFEDQPHRQSFRITR